MLSMRARVLELSEAPSTVLVMSMFADIKKFRDETNVG